MKWWGIATAAMWVSVGAAICFCIYTTESIGALWAFLIPVLSGYMFSGEKKKEENK